MYVTSRFGEMKRVSKRGSPSLAACIMAGAPMNMSIMSRLEKTSVRLATSMRKSLRGTPSSLGRIGFVGFSRSIGSERPVDLSGSVVSTLGVELSSPIGSGLENVGAASGGRLRGGNGSKRLSEVLSVGRSRGGGCPGASKSRESINFLTSLCATSGHNCWRLATRIGS